MPLSPPPEAALNAQEPGRVWANLGLWAPGRSYPQAARALAQRVADAAALRADDTLLEVGCGPGESLRLWREHYGCREILAMEPDAAAVAWLLEQTWLLDQTRLRDQSELRGQGGARGLRLLQRPAEQIADCVPPRSVDVLLAVDCAYHLRQSPAFWARCARTLRPGGRLAFTDLGLAARISQAQRWTLRRLAPLFGIPPGNLCAAPAQAERLRRAGFAAPHCEDLSAEVGPGFAQWWRGYRRRAGIPRRLWWRCELTARTLPALLASGGLRYRLWSARLAPGQDIAPGRDRAAGRDGAPG